MLRRMNISFDFSTTAGGGPGRNIRPSNFYGIKKKPSQSPSMRLLGRLPSLNMDDDDLRRSRSSKSLRDF